MTVSSQTNKITYIGNGVATEFAIPFYFLSESHLKVYQLLNDIQTTSTNYSVQGVKNEDGGTIIFDTAPASGAEILIIRNVPMTQETDYQDNQVFHANTLEQALDKLTMQVQQLSERIDRAVTVDVFSEQNGSDLLPSIKQSVSDSATYAQTATEQAELATGKVVLATEQAMLATTKANEAISTVDSKVNIDIDNISNSGKNKIVSLCMPDYASGIEGTATTADKIQVTTDSYVYLAGTDPYIINATVWVTPSPDAENQYPVMNLYSDINSNTQGMGCCFMCPKDWFFFSNFEHTYTYRIYPLKGVLTNA